MYKFTTKEVSIRKRRQSRLLKLGQIPLLLIAPLLLSVVAPAVIGGLTTVPTGVQPAQAQTAATSHVYRFWSPKFDNAHFYTTSLAERDALITNDNSSRGGNWTYEGAAFSAKTDSCAPNTSVYRFWSQAYRSHFFTSSEAEKATVAQDPNWRYENVAYCAEPATSAETQPLYRFFSPTFKKHFYTASQPEKNQLESDPNWTYENVAYYVYPVSAGGSVIPPPPPPATGKWNTYKGFNYMAWQRDSYTSANAQNSLNQLAGTKANSVSINTIWYQDGKYSTTMYRDPVNTASDASMVTAIQRAKAKGLKVMIRPMVNSQGNAVWRGSFSPSDRTAWFNNYRAMMNNYAVMAQANGVELLDIGSEFNSLQGFPTEWRKIVADARARYSGKITYSANWDSYQRVTWYDAVDIIGIDAYFPLSNGSTPSVSTIVERWTNNPTASNSNHRQIITDITAVRNKFNKPVVFTELGYRSGTNTLDRPWANDGNYAPEEQQRALEAAFAAWDNKPWFLGVFIWQWNADPGVSGPNGGPGDTDHTPQGKPAQQTVTNRFSTT